MRTLALLLVCVLGASAWAGETLPRYKLEAGQVLVFEEAGTFDIGGRAMDRTIRYQFWVLGTNPDGSWRMALLQDDPRRLGLVWFGLHPDGRIVDDPSFVEMTSPSAVFHRLPANATERDNGWHRKETCWTNRYEALPEDPETPGFRMRIRRDGPSDIVYKRTRDTVFRFDSKTGLPASIRTEVDQKAAGRSSGVMTTTLTSTATLDAAARKQFGADLDAWIAEAKRSEADREAAHGKPEAMRTAIEKEGERLAALAKTIKTDAVRQALEKRREKLPRETAYQVGEAERVAGVLGKAAPDFTLTGVDGKAVSLKELRGRVVVLDFWYRDCGWCMEGMPQIKALVAHCENMPVTVLGLNTDRDHADARFVHEALKFEHATLLGADSVSAGFGVLGFPTLVVIGPKGVIRDVRSGFEQHLVDRVTQLAGELLAEQDGK